MKVKYYLILFSFLSFQTTLISQTSTEFFPGGNTCYETSIGEEIFFEPFNGNDLSNSWQTHYGQYCGNTPVDDCFYARTHTEEGNLAPQVLLDENLDVSQGTLKINLIKENTPYFGQDVPFSSGVIVSDSDILNNIRGHFRLETRCKLPVLKGREIATVWMFGWHNEFDLFEYNRGPDLNAENKLPVNLIRWEPEPDDEHTSFQKFPTKQEANVDNFGGEWHTYAMEFTSMHVKYFVDDTEVATYGRYIEQDAAGDPVTSTEFPFCPWQLNLSDESLCPELIDDCFIPTGEKLMNDVFPLSGSQNLRVIAGFKAAYKFDDIVDQTEDSTFEIDYIKINSLNFCNPFDLDVNRDIAQGENPTTTLGWGTFNFNNITVRTGNELRIRDAQLNMGGNIFLEQGARLIVEEGSMITSCQDGKLWEGIRMSPGVAQVNPEVAIENIDANGAPVVIVQEGSIIEKAKVAISTSDDSWEAFICALSGGINCNYSGTVIIRENATLQNNEKGVFVFISNQDQSIVTDANFIDNNTAIHIGASERFLITNSFFSGGEIGIGIFGSEIREEFGIESCVIQNMTEEGIYLETSDVDVLGHNILNNNYIGIQAGGTFPGEVNLNVGVNDMQATNFFGGNYIGVRAEGVDGPLGSEVINNSIIGQFGNLSFAGMFLGANRVAFENNQLHSARIGTWFVSTGDEQNTVNCNENLNIEACDHFFSGRNIGTQFLENTSNGNVDFNTYLAGAEMPAIIGGFNPMFPNLIIPADNCFTQFGTDILADDVAWVPFTGNTPRYLHNDVDDCVDPDLVLGNNILVEEIVEPFENICEMGIGIFPFIEEDSLLNGSLIDTTIVLGCSSQEIQDGINNAINEIIQNGGDNPYTEVIEQTSSNNTISLSALTSAEGKLDNYLNLILYQADLIDDYDCADDAIKWIKRWHWKQKRFGNYLKKGDLTVATNYLNSLNPTNVGEQYFVDVQKINLKRLKKASGEEVEYSESDFQTLIEVGESHYPAAGYARTIHRIITGKRMPLPYFEIPNAAIPRSVTHNSNITIPSIFPNPTNGILNIDQLDWNDPVSLQLMTIRGQLILNKTISSNTQLDLSEFSEGIYLIRLNLSNGETVNKKIILQK